MHIRSWIGAASLAVALAACSGSPAGNDANESGNAANGTAAAPAYDSNSAEGRAYRAVLECAATHEAAASIVGGVSMSKTGAERQQYLDEETRRKGQARVLKARAVELGAALGLPAATVEEQFTAHTGTFVQTSSSGTMDQFGATVSAQANACAANYPDLIN